MAFNKLNKHLASSFVRVPISGAKCNNFTCPSHGFRGGCSRARNCGYGSFTKPAPGSRARDRVLQKHIKRAAGKAENSIGGLRKGGTPFFFIEPWSNPGLFAAPNKGLELGLFQSDYLRAVAWGIDAAGFVA